MKALIIDDEEQARGMMTYYLNEFFSDIEIVGSCSGITEGTEVFFKTHPDIVFLDISMPSGSGFELANRLDFTSTFVVFVTAHAEYALDAFKVNAFDYLLKPLHITELTRVINKARVNQKNVLPVQQTQQSRLDRKIKLKYEGKIHLIDTREVEYIRSEGSYTTIVLASGKEMLISKNIKKIEEEYFSALPFVRTHQSYIININKVKEFDANEIILTNSVSVPLSKAKYAEFRTLMDQL